MTEQPPADMTALPDLLHGRGRPGPVRQRRPAYVDLLPPCNAGYVTALRAANSHAGPW